MTQINPTAESHVQDSGTTIHALRRQSTGFADADTARRAVALALPMLAAAADDVTVCSAGSLYVVVMNPALSPELCEFEAAILLEQSVGVNVPTRSECATTARGKARLSWRMRRDTHLVHGRLAEELIERDSHLAGGIWLDGITIAVSGAHAVFDVAFATAVAANLRALSAYRLALALQARSDVPRRGTGSAQPSR